MEPKPPQVFRLPHELSRVPTDIGGIYSFCLRFPSDYELGLASHNVDVPRVRRRIEAFVERVTPVLKSPLALSGSLASGQDARHLRTVLTLQAERCDIAGPVTELRSYLVNSGDSVEALRNAAALLRLLFSSATPSYIGMTARQSLSARLLQHYQRRTKFGQALVAMGVPWTFFDFRCVPIDRLTPDVARSLERVAQTLFHPHLSSR